MIRIICIIPCLFLVFLYAWPFTGIRPLGSSDRRALLLVQNALRAAHDTVHESMRDLLAKSGDELRATSGWNAAHYSGDAKIERLQAALDDVQRLGNDTNLCTSLGGKRIIMIGGEHIYRLHLHLLRHRECAEGKPFPCPYHEFCTHHHICLPFDPAHHSVSQPRYVKSPSTQALAETGSAIVTYIVSDTLLSVRNESSWEYTLPFVDRLTGVRLRETYWLAAARKAHVVILGRGPLSAPGETYTGNWSFLRDVSDYVRARHPDASHSDAHHAQSIVPGALEMLNAAVHFTISRFLPDLFQLMQSIREEVRPGRGKRLLWPSTWYRLPDRGVARCMFQRMVLQRTRPRSLADKRQKREDLLVLHLLALVNANGADASVVEDPWTLLFNAQGIYLQNLVLEEVLARFGITFLPLSHASWTEELDQGGHGHPHWYEHGHGLDGYVQDSAKEERIDIHRIGDMFLNGLDHILKFPEVTGY